MVDRLFSDPELAALYDLFCPWEQRDDVRFYMPMIMSARAVLDVGCGTGALLHHARQSGHSGRLCGLDPAIGMLEQARKQSDIEWFLGDLTSMAREEEFDLIVMTGHAFQALVGDDEIRTALTAIRSALTGDGRFAFETRNPPALAWRRWTPEHYLDVTTDSGTVVRLTHDVELPVEGDLVRFSSIYTSPEWDRPKLSRSTLRFLDADSLRSFLKESGLEIERQFGDWSGGRLTDASPEIITIAQRA